MRTFPTSLRTLKDAQLTCTTSRRTRITSVRKSKDATPSSKASVRGCKNAMRSRTAAVRKCKMPVRVR